MEPYPQGDPRAFGYHIGNFSARFERNHVTHRLDTLVLTFEEGTFEGFLHPDDKVEIDMTKDAFTKFHVTYDPKTEKAETRTAGRECKNRKGVIMATASKNARKVLNSIKAKLNLDKFPRGTFIEGFGDDLAYIRYNGCIEGRFSSGELTDEEAEERAQKIIDTCGAPELITSEDFLAPEDIPPCMRG